MRTIQKSIPEIYQLAIMNICHEGMPTEAALAVHIMHLRPFSKLKNSFLVGQRLKQRSRNNNAQTTQIIMGAGSGPLELEFE